LNEWVERGGEESPRDELRGDGNAEAETGEFKTEGILLSKSCKGRGPVVGEVKAGELGAVTTLMLISCMYMNCRDVWQPARAVNSRMQACVQRVLGRCRRGRTNVKKRDSGPLRHW
jgi:hypothetical protein